MLWVSCEQKLNNKDRCEAPGVIRQDGLDHITGQRLPMAPRQSRPPTNYTSIKRIKKMRVRIVLERFNESASLRFLHYRHFLFLESSWACRVNKRFLGSFMISKRRILACTTLLTRAFAHMRFFCCCFLSSIVSMLRMRHIRFFCFNFCTCFCFVFVDTYEDSAAILFQQPPLFALCFSRGLFTIFFSHGREEKT